MNCGLPETVCNATSKLTGHVYGDTVTYQCNMGFRAHGPVVRTCTALGHWSGTPPACRGGYNVLVLLYEQEKKMMD